MSLWPLLSFETKAIHVDHRPWTIELLIHLASSVGSRFLSLSETSSVDFGSSMLLSPIIFAAILLSYSSSYVAFAWGGFGHQTIAWIAQSYLLPATETAIRDALDSQLVDYMANASTWADSYRYTESGKFSRPFHYIDANDDPPTTCSVDYERDCGDDGCSVSAIVNYTSILSDSDSSPPLRKDAARFLIHFIGDLHQPLHDEALEGGGNGINVTYDGDETNLHHIWDTEIVEQLAAGASAEAFAKNLTVSIKAGEFDWDSTTWVKGASLNMTLATVMTWAREANGYVCTEVLKGGVDAVEEGDLSGKYYGAHFDVARVQLARAGFRLGAWLNLIVTGKMG
ncbi:hypothetical protein LTR84_001953 [Exophiala bonariae]|uniref:Aspergillus nuclease S(1) n=1 Tax=Exophiala bonariae TaxID=1690606 RepID=A0AAV9NEJ0_9EURO|nr:hypothetical protein LTR84_001953 [Exophiala bonariae]